jgi:predicted dehydrogenase
VSRKTIGLACLGTGYVSEIHARCAAGVEGVQLKAVWSRTQESGRRFSERHRIPRVYTDYRQLLDDPEVNAVIIGLPTPMHHATALEAAKVGKHVLCEKPIAMTVGEGEEMIRSAAAAGVVLMIAHVLRFWPEYMAAKQLTEGGSLGKIVSLSAYRLSSVPRWSAGSWLLDPGQSGGVPVDLHIHDIDFIRWLLGEPLDVAAKGSKDPNGLVSDIVSLFQFRGALASARASYTLPEGEKFRAGFKLIGDRGVLEYDNLSKPTLSLSQNGRAQPPPALRSVEPYAAQLEYFAECVRTNGSPSRCPPDESLKALALSLRVKSLVD